MNPFDWERALVERHKVVEYLLNDEHPVGGAKSAFFRQFGFRRHEWERLADALRSHALANNLPMVIPTQYGLRVVVRGPLQAPDGRRPRVVAVWQIDNQSPVPRLITAYPDDSGESLA